MAGSNARDTLEKAKLFLDEAASAEARPLPSRPAFTAKLEAAITNGHSVWDHLCAEFARRPGADGWKQTRRNMLEAKPVFLFISEQGKRGMPRNNIGMRHRITHFGGNFFLLASAVRVAIVSAMRLTVTATVIRAQPWV
jgi:hypothetical protein